MRSQFKPAHTLLHIHAHITQPHTSVVFSMLPYVYIIRTLPNGVCVRYEKMFLRLIKSNCCQRVHHTGKTITQTVAVKFCRINSSSFVWRCVRVWLRMRWFHEFYSRCVVWKQVTYTNPTEAHGLYTPYIFTPKLIYTLHFYVMYINIL